MTGEMSRSEVTPEAYPVHFAIANALGGTVHPFDQYQGPFVSAAGHRLWLTGEGDGFVAVYSETAHRQSQWFPESMGEELAPDEARELIEGGGIDPDNMAAHCDAVRLCAIGEA